MNALTTFSDMRFGEIRTTEESGKVLFCGSGSYDVKGLVKMAKLMHLDLRGADKAVKSL